MTPGPNRDDCEKFEIEIGMRQHGALDAAEEALLDAHLATCDGCREFARLSGATASTLQADVRDEVARIDWGAMERGIARLRRNYRLKLWLAPLFLLQVPLTFLIATGHLPPPDVMAVGPVSTVAIYVGWVWLVNRPFREVLAVVKSPEDLLRAYRRELRRQKLRTGAFVAVNGALTLFSAAMIAAVPDLRGKLIVAGVTAVMAAWTAYDLRWKLPRINRALAALGTEAEGSR